jgi:hypothetical protein
VEFGAHPGSSDAVASPSRLIFSFPRYLRQRESRLYVWPSYWAGEGGVTQAALRPVAGVGARPLRRKLTEPHSHSRFSDLGTVDWLSDQRWGPETGTPPWPKVGPAGEGVKVGGAVKDPRHDGWTSVAQNEPVKSSMHIRASDDQRIKKTPSASADVGAFINTFITSNHQYT